MSTAPMVAIIGRPNVGKSSLFNALIKERIAIEEPTEGVTRDRLIRAVEVGGKKIQLVDTGGIGVVDRQDLEADVGEQIEFAIGSADLIVFVLDGQNDLTELDRKVAKIVRESEVPLILVANKIDNETLEHESSKFMALGFGEPLLISVLHSINLASVAHSIAKQVPNVVEGSEGDGGIRIALSGRRNVGKSSLTNYLCGEKRVIVSDRAGTTRDAIDVHLKWGDLDVTLVDTAGLRKKNQTEDSIEFFSVNRTFGALYRSDIGILMLDSEQGVSQVDQKLGKWYVDHHKPCILVINKWDLAAGRTNREEYDVYLDRRLPGLSHAPRLYVSVMKGEGIDLIYDAIQTCWEQMNQEFSTNEINDALQKAQDQNRPRVKHGTIPKLFYATQLKQQPPTFLVFGKSTQKIGSNYKRYLSQYFQKHLGLSHLPIQFVFRNRESRFS